MTMCADVVLIHRSAARTTPLTGRVADDLAVMGVRSNEPRGRSSAPTTNSTGSDGSPRGRKRRSAPSRRVVGRLQPVGERSAVAVDLTDEGRDHADVDMLSARVDDGRPLLDVELHEGRQRQS